MDGTIIDSTAAVEKHWHTIGKELGLDPNVILQTSHGRRSIDVLAIVSPEKANWEYIKHMEGLLPLHYGADVLEIPGARALLASCTEEKVPWAIVTSGTTPLVGGWLEVLKLPTPKHLVTAEDVKEGKPHPECYLKGLRKLGLVEGANVLVLEDSPAGIKAGKEAGCQVVAVVTSHTVEQIINAKPDWIVKDLSSLKVVGVSEKGVEIEFLDALALE